MESNRTKRDYSKNIQHRANWNSSKRKEREWSISNIYRCTKKEFCTFDERSEFSDSRSLGNPKEEK